MLKQSANVFQSSLYLIDCLQPYELLLCWTFLALSSRGSRGEVVSLLQYGETTYTIYYIGALSLMATGRDLQYWL